MGGACSTYPVYRISIVRPEGSGPLGRPEASAAVISAKETPVHIGGHPELVLDAWRREIFPQSCQYS